MSNVVWFADLGLADLEQVGGKNASLGEMIANLSSAGVQVPDGFATCGDNGLQVIMMCELPSNPVIADAFLDHFDGFSIGSNDMTQLTLGLDRDSALVADGFDERDPAVKFMLSAAISAKPAASTSAPAAKAPPTTPTTPSGCWTRDRVHVTQPRYFGRYLAPPRRSNHGGGCCPRGPGESGRVPRSSPWRRQIQLVRITRTSRRSLARSDRSVGDEFER
jgi:hypothetical protein